MICYKLQKNSIVHHIDYIIKNLIFKINNNFVLLKIKNYFQYTILCYGDTL